MSNTRFDDKLRAHYDGRSMEPERLSLLATLAEQTAQSGLSQSRTLPSTGGRLSRTAVVLLVFVAGALAVQWRTSRQNETELAGRVETLLDREKELDSALQGTETRCRELEKTLAMISKSADAPAADSPRYVAVCVSSNKCTHCEDTRRLFHKLIEQHGADNVMFVSLDVSSPAERKQSERLACEMGLNWATGECGKCCAIRLFDRHEKQLVATQFALNSSDEFERKFNETIRKSGG